ncbi:MAG TPA: hypothetical protein VFQ43_09325, partial [Nitrososphaera sp.]|nr:hypothetical protein [Nitrososphaera sp.]
MDLVWSSLGIFINYAPSTNVYIANNSIGYDRSGHAVDALSGRLKAQCNCHREKSCATRKQNHEGAKHRRTGGYG